MTDPQGSSEHPPTVRVLIFLLADVGADLLQFEPHGGHRVASRPEGLAREVALLAAKLPRNRNGTLALQESDHLCHRYLGRNGDTHMDMIRHDVSLKNLT